MTMFGYQGGFYNRRHGTYGTYMYERPSYTNHRASFILFSLSREAYNALPHSNYGKNLIKQELDNASEYDPQKFIEAIVRAIKKYYPRFYISNYMLVVTDIASAYNASKKKIGYKEYAEGRKKEIMEKIKHLLDTTISDFDVRNKLYSAVDKALDITAGLDGYRIKDLTKIIIAISAIVYYYDEMFFRSIGAFMRNKFDSIERVISCVYDHTEHEYTYRNLKWNDGEYLHTERIAKNPYMAEEESNESGNDHLTEGEKYIIDNAEYEIAQSQKERMSIEFAVDKMFEMMLVDSFSEKKEHSKRGKLKLVSKKLKDLAKIVNLPTWIVSNTNEYLHSLEMLEIIQGRRKVNQHERLSHKKLYVLIDDSGSMDMQKKKRAIYMIMNKLEKLAALGVEVAVYPFVEDVDYRNGGIVGEDNIRLSFSHGMTDIKKAIEQINSNIREDEDIDPSNIGVIIVNDGQDNPKDAVPVNGVKASCVALMCENSKLKELCLNSGGAYIVYKGD